MHGPYATGDACSQHRSLVRDVDIRDSCLLEGNTVNALELVDLVGIMDSVDDQDDELQLSLSPATLHGDEVEIDFDPSFVVALFCDGFVCRHWTQKSGWVEGFAQSYDATSRFFLDCLEKERLPDGLLELIDSTTPSNELRAEIWDLRTHSTALCPLTAADLPHTAPLPAEIAGVSVRQVVLKPRDNVVLTEIAKFAEHELHPASEQFPHLSNADLEALTNDELASLALGPDVDLVQVDESLALLSVDEVAGPAAEGLCTSMEVSVLDAVTLSPTAEVVGVPSVSNCGDDRDGADAFGYHELITPKRATSNDLPPWRVLSTSASSPTAFFSPNESKAMRPHARQRGAGRRGASGPSIGETTFVSWPSEGSHSSDDDWIVKSGIFRSITPAETEAPFIKSENPSPPSERRRPAKQAKKKKDSRPTLPAIRTDSPLDRMPASCVHRSLSHEANNYIDAVNRKNASKKSKKIKYQCLKPSIDGGTPLPATHFFLSRLKGKRPRNYTIDELDHGSPAWMMMKHMTLFYHAALSFERHHAHFLQVNVERIMTADSTAAKPTKVAAGSMNYLAMQLDDWTRPDEVIAAASETQERSSPSAAKTKRRIPSDAWIKSVADKEQVSMERLSSAALRAGEARSFEEELSTQGEQSPTTAFARIRINSPTTDALQFTNRSALPPLLTTLHPQVSRPSVLSPLTPLGGSARTGSSFIDHSEGEAFEF